jgi:hypothetical protein
MIHEHSWQGVGLFDMLMKNTKFKCLDFPNDACNIDNLNRSLDVFLHNLAIGFQANKTHNVNVPYCSRA